MGTNKKKKSLLKKLRSKYRLAIFNEQTYEEVFVVKLSRLNVFTIVGTFGVLLVILVTILIAFTSLRDYIPGYPDANQRLLIVRNAQRVDSLIVELEKRDRFIQNFQTILRGDIPEQLASPEDEPSLAASDPNMPIDFSRSEADSLFRRQVEREERFNLSMQQPTSRAIALESTFFVSPIKGMIVNSFMETQGHYGVDIVAAPGTRVSAIMDGMVVFSGWTVETGYVIQIQHPNNILSIYKHNETLLKEVGQTVKAGEAIARIGNTGELTTGPHLHFELWYNGTPLNPVDYISF
ncbi:M23 family metallopeptidase [Alkalitalea saponilacus]|uniref:Murein DD-endopeptidase MepM and murein hydrolase activator NlpD, contain LysM domain n=1 Tax=Alkalitalea saponilacus TaxID=889453 RepID=A0A1T5FWP8_9BACT|nr:M23 family metallopeptidase [Alkalitalea saponilacus]ASB49516.1 peptidase M23 [Alkalitalea saponilacus]SKC00598.1 Murein DD-endopeptidase MepM and murein hydrolase activator NlpD, contain LysM domain [Alkalitalea saponilacus]